MTLAVWSETEKERGTTMKKIFIDGSAGTTGLNIRERLKNRQEIELLTLKEEKRKDIDARLSMIKEADAAFLCLPDAASREIVQLAGDVDTVLIDTSTAHRTAQGWTYGLPELKGKRKVIAGAKRIANPGCHATGYIVLTAPLAEAGILDPEKTLSFTSLTGYSGGGKRMIAEYEAPEREGKQVTERCPGCGREVHETDKFCLTCGTKIERKEIETVEDAETISAPEETAEERPHDPEKEVFSGEVVDEKDA